MNQPVFNQVDFAQLAYAYGQPDWHATFKASPEDFTVTELNPFTLSGEGEHLWLFLEKRGENSEWLAGEVAKWAGVARNAVGMAGQKDRHAVTRQWLSVQLPGRENPDWSSWPHPQVRLLKAQRHLRKLQTGGLSGNRFEICLRSLKSAVGDFSEAEKSIFESRLQQIAQQGVPNYFGAQRFGKGGNNLPKAIAMLQAPRRVPRHKKSLYLSTLRSWAFNCALSQRVMQGNWNQALPGEVFQLAGSQRCFADDATPELAERLRSGDIHPSGVLIGDLGRGWVSAQGPALAYEQQSLEPFQSWQQALAGMRVEADRRALRLIPQALHWQWQPSSARDESLDLHLQFELPVGTYATMLLREFCHLQEPHRAGEGERDDDKLDDGKS
ncbi:MAG: tRNA pseudouridine(13) synthase TruD [Thiotrichales bacterium]|nr:tRNA pseudouridine(13) synthase TruD [Thiotrichales bacterium]